MAIYCRHDICVVPKSRLYHIEYDNWELFYFVALQNNIVIQSFDYVGWFTDCFIFILYNESSGLFLAPPAISMPYICNISDKDHRVEK